MPFIPFIEDKTFKAGPTAEEFFEVESKLEDEEYRDQRIHTLSKEMERRFLFLAAEIDKLKKDNKIKFEFYDGSNVSEKSGWHLPVTDDK